MTHTRSWTAIVASAGLAVALLTGAGAAQARSDVNWSVGIGVPGVVVGASNSYGYYAPPPVVYTPPPPVIYAPPRPVYYAPPPVYYSPPPYGYYRGGRYEEHRRWRHHHRHGRD